VGYTHLPVSVQTDAGMAELRAACAGDIAVFVGQSGVGKSSLISRLVPEADIRTGELMLRTQEGTHTTTASHLYDLAGGGHLIDSPGVRDFAPALSRLEPTSLGFLEVAQRAPHCRFDDCRHLKEPACAVRAASESGEISPRRYESYRRLRRLFETLGARR
jgi:ribosome biogenesis GTPase